LGFFAAAVATGCAAAGFVVCAAVPRAAAPTAARVDALSCTIATGGALEVAAGVARVRAAAASEPDG
jgi:hypothetical protein